MAKGMSSKNAMLLFGILFLIAGLGLWGGAPAWWNGWTLIGAFLLVWGLWDSMM